MKEDSLLEKNGNEFPISKLGAFCEERCLNLLKEVFDERHDFFVYEVRKFLLENNVGHQQQKSQKWIPIESLSMLRAEVGGRFQNLKERWVNSGFPLKEHKGEQISEFEVNQAGWIEMRNWLYKQGYEAKLSERGNGTLFEITKIEE